MLLRSVHSCLVEKGGGGGNIDGRDRTDNTGEPGMDNAPELASMADGILGLNGATDGQHHHPHDNDAI